MRQYNPLKVMAVIVTVCLFLTFLTGCTYGKVTMADGSTISYFDLHPAGNAVEVYGEKEGLGIFWIERDTADSTEVVGTVVDAATPGLL